MLYFCHAEPKVKVKIHSSEDLHAKICAIGYYLGFYSSLKDKNWRNDGHFKILSKDKEKGWYLSFMVYILSLNHEKQMIDAFYTS